MTHERDADRAGIARTETDLDLGFAALRAAPPMPPDTLRLRVLADAATAQGRPAAVRQAGAPASPGAFAGLWRAMGGWGAGAGLATATLAGLAIGFGAPDVIPDVTGTAGSGDVDLAVWLWPDVGAMLDGLSAAEEG